MRSAVNNKFSSRFTRIGVTVVRKCRHSIGSIVPLSKRIRAQTRKLKCILCFSNKLRQTFVKKANVRFSLILAIRSLILSRKLNH